MTFSLLSLHVSVLLCLLCVEGVQAALLPASSRQALSRRYGDLENRQTTEGAQCAVAGDVSCYQGLPIDVCCGPQDSCLVTAANTTAICIPKGTPTTPFMILPITCNLSLQDWKENPQSRVKTIALESPLQSCGTDSCCPHGFLCSEDGDSHRCILDDSVGADRKYRRLRPASIPLVTEYPDTTDISVIEQIPDADETTTQTQPSETSTSNGGSSSTTPDNGTGITSLTIPANTGEPSTGTSGGSPESNGQAQPGGNNMLSIGLIVGVAISAAATAGLAFFVWLRRKQLFPRRPRPLWADWKSASPGAPPRQSTPLVEVDNKDSIPEMAVRAYNTAEMPADAPLCELPSPAASPAASRTLSLPAYVSELPGSPVPDRRASIVPLSSWNTRDASRFERVKTHWYQKRGG